MQAVGSHGAASRPFAMRCAETPAPPLYRYSSMPSIAARSRRKSLYAYMAHS